MYRLIFLKVRIMSHKKKTNLLDSKNKIEKNFKWIFLYINQKI